MNVSRAALLRDLVDPDPRRLHQEPDVLRSAERRRDQRRLVAGVRQPRRRRVGVDARRERLQRGEIEDLDVADDVRQTASARGLPAPPSSAGSLLPAKFSMLKPPTVNSSAAAARTARPLMLAPAVGGVSGSSL